MSTAPQTNVAYELSRAKYEKDARDALSMMRKREEDERFDFSYDPYTSTLRYRVRIDQENNTDWERAYFTAQRIAAKHGAKVINVRWGKDYWMCELVEIVAHPQHIS